MLVGQLFSALTSLILMARGDEDATRGVMFWLLGALGSARWSSLAAVVPVCTVGVLINGLMSRYLDRLGFGDLTAESMGVPVKAVRAIVLVTVA